MSQGGFLQWGNVQQQFDCPDSLQSSGVIPKYQKFWNIEAMCNMWISETNIVVLAARVGDLFYFKYTNSNSGRWNSVERETHGISHFIHDNLREGWIQAFQRETLLATHAITLLSVSETSNKCMNSKHRFIETISKPDSQWLGNN
jgi:hypothetical protein